MTLGALALTLMVGLQVAPAPQVSSIPDAATLSRAEEVAAELGRYLAAVEQRFEAGGDPLSGEPGPALFSDDARAILASARPESHSSWAAGTPDRPLTVVRHGETALLLDDATGREDAFDQVREIFREIESQLGGRPTRAAEIWAKSVLVATNAAPDSWNVRLRVRHVRHVAGGAVVATRSIWQVQVTFEASIMKLVAWAGSVVETVQLDAPGEGAGPQSSGFVDVTASVLVGERARWLAPSIMALRGRLDVDVGVGILGHHGVAVADVNGDGIEDIYLCQPGGIPNQLWLRRADGTAVESAAALGLGLVDLTMSALFVDLDGDLDRDVVLGLSTEVLILVCTPEGYHVAARHELSSVTSMAAADVDGDGRIDVFACAYAHPYDGSTLPNPYHDAENGQENLLLANVTQRPDELRFRNATRDSGLDVAGSRFSIAATFEDVDEDGDVDLYVANDFGRNAFYFNDGQGHFTNRAAELGVEDVAAGMGASFADIDGDGRVDLYVANMESSAGSRVTGQEHFRSDVDDETRSLFRRHAKGNTLFLRDAQGGFRETGLATAGQWAWGAIPIDLDGNGALDLFVPNGFVTGTDAETPDL